MKTITRHDTAFVEAARRVACGASTREQESAALGVNPGTFAVWMSRSKITASRNPDNVKKLHGAALGWVTTDPDKAKAMDEATARVLAGEITSTQAARDYPELADARAAIAARVRRAKVQLKVQLKELATET
jgi:hypothetical protein